MITLVQKDLGLLMKKKSKSKFNKGGNNKCLYHQPKEKHENKYIKVLKKIMKKLLRY